MSERLRELREEFERRSFRAPQIVFDDAKIRAFDAMLARAAAPDRAGPAIRYDAPYPKHEFLCYLTDRRDCLLHGSNNSRIELFEPRFQTDAGGRALERVYASSDGILALYFAIVSRRRNRGSLRNWFFRRVEDGVERRYYFFSVNRDALERGGPWTSGAVYVLPRDAFEPTIVEDDPTLEWASAVAVRPVAKLHVAPSDFPFLDRVEGHDDSGAIRIGELQLTLLRHLKRIEDAPEGARLVLRPRRGVWADLEELVVLVDELGVLSDVTMSLGNRAGDPCLNLSGEGAAQLANSIRRAERGLRVVRKIPGALRLLAFLRRR